MREQLNDNPIAQVVLVGLLVAVGAFLFLRMNGGEDEGEEAAPNPTVAIVNGATAVGDTPGDAVEGAIANLEAGASAVGGTGAIPSSVPAPPPPDDFVAAYESGQTVVLLIVHDGSIDDDLTAAATEQASSQPGVALFEIPAKLIHRYAAVTVGLDVNRVPALVVMRPKKLSGDVPRASVEYGFQTPQSVAQAIRDADYSGPEETYHPD
ncbi:MAG: hypothetical protein R2725_15150 [Solirubrobacterales bacterium]